MYIVSSFKPDLTPVGKCVDILFVSAHHMILYWNKSLWYLNFVKFYVYIINIYWTEKRDGISWEKVLPPTFRV